MNTLGTCFIEQQIQKIKLKVRSTIALASLFDHLKKVLNCLLHHPQNPTSRNLNKNMLGSMFQLKEVQDLFEILGFFEDNDTYIFNLCDENLKKLESCLTIIEGNSGSFSEQQQVSQINLALSNLPLKTIVNEGHEEYSKPKKASSKHLKDLFLSKHLKKEQTSHVVGSIYTRKSSFTFNSNGYFCQRSNNTRQNKAFLLQKVFDGSDFDYQKRMCLIPK